MHSCTASLQAPCAGPASRLVLVIAVMFAAATLIAAPTASDAPPATTLPRTQVATGDSSPTAEALTGDREPSPGPPADTGPPVTLASPPASPTVSTGASDPREIPVPPTVPQDELVWLSLEWHELQLMMASEARRVGAIDDQAAEVLLRQAELIADLATLTGEIRQRTAAMTDPIPTGQLESVRLDLRLWASRRELLEPRIEAVRTGIAQLQLVGQSTQELLAEQQRARDELDRRLRRLARHFSATSTVAVPLEHLVRQLQQSHRVLQQSRDRRAETIANAIASGTAQFARIERLHRELREREQALRQRWEQSNEAARLQQQQDLEKTARQAIASAQRELAALNTDVEDLDRQILLPLNPSDPLASARHDQLQIRRRAHAARIQAIEIGVQHYQALLMRGEERQAIEQQRRTLIAAAAPETLVPDIRRKVATSLGAIEQAIGVAEKARQVLASERQLIASQSESLTAPGPAASGTDPLWQERAAIWREHLGSLDAATKGLSTLVLVLQERHQSLRTWDAELAAMIVAHRERSLFARRLFAPRTTLSRIAIDSAAGGLQWLRRTAGQLLTGLGVAGGISLLLQILVIVGGGYHLQARLRERWPVLAQPPDAAEPAGHTPTPDPAVPGGPAPADHPDAQGTPDAAATFSAAAATAPLRGTTSGTGADARTMPSPVTTTGQTVLATPGRAGEPAATDGPRCRGLASLSLAIVRWIVHEWHLLATAATLGLIGWHLPAVLPLVAFALTVTGSIATVHLANRVVLPQFVGNTALRPPMARLIMVQAIGLPPALMLRLIPGPPEFSYLVEMVIKIGTIFPVFELAHLRQQAMGCFTALTAFDPKHLAHRLFGWLYSFFVIVSLVALFISLAGYENLAIVIFTQSSSYFAIFLLYAAGRGFAGELANAMFGPGDPERRWFALPEKRATFYHFLSRKLLRLLNAVVALLLLIRVAGVSTGIPVLASLQAFLHAQSDWIMGRVIHIAIIVIGLYAALEFFKTVGESVIEYVHSTEHLHQAEVERRASTLVQIVHTTTRVVIFCLAGIMILRELGMDITPLLTGAGIVGVAIGFGSQSLVKDFFAGFFILIENQFRVGDVIKIGGISGVVEKINLKTTVLRDQTGTVHIIPNGEISSVSNMTYGWSQAVIDIDVSYSADIDKAMAVLLQTAQEMAQDPALRMDIWAPPEMLGVEALGESGVKLRLLIRTRPLSQWNIARQFRRRAKVALDRVGIEIPFPQRTVHLRTPPPVPGP